MSLSRRQLLRALGVTAAAPGLLGGCGAGDKQVRNAGGSAHRSLTEIRAQLREVVAILRARYADASAMARLTTRGGALIDDSEQTTYRERDALVVLRVQSGGRTFEQVTTDASAGGIAVAARDLAAVAPRDRAGGQIQLGEPRNFAVSVKIDPMRKIPAAWLARVREMRSGARDIGGSRIIHRGAGITVADESTIFVGQRRDLLQRIVRTRAAVSLIAWTGSSPTADEAVRSGIMGLEATTIAAKRIEAAASRALALLTARPAPRRSGTLLLDPTVGALLIHSCLAPALEAGGWLTGSCRAGTLLGKQLGSNHVTVVDDPRPRAGLGGYYFDDEGVKAAPTVLVERGMLRAALADRSSAASLGLTPTANARRAGFDSASRPVRSNVALSPGTASRADLLAAIRSGLLLEGGVSARIDLRTMRFSIRCARAREIRNGSLSGVLYGTAGFHGDLVDVLRSVRGVSAKSSRFGASANGLATSMSSPWIWCSGVVA